MPTAAQAGARDVTGFTSPATRAPSPICMAAVGTRGFSTTVRYSLPRTARTASYGAQVARLGLPVGWNLDALSDSWPTGTGSGIPVYQAGGDTLGRVDLAIAPTIPIMYMQSCGQSAYGQQGRRAGWRRTADAGTTWNMQAGLATIASGRAAMRRRAQNWYNRHASRLIQTIRTHCAGGHDRHIPSPGNADLRFNITCGYNWRTGACRPTCSEYAWLIKHIIDGRRRLGFTSKSRSANAGTPTFTQLNDSLSTIEYYSGDITANFANAAQPWEPMGEAG